MKKINIIPLFIILSTLVSCSCKTGFEYANFNGMEMRTIDKLHVELLLPKNIEIEYFSGKYLNDSIVRNEARVDLHTLYRGCLTEWSKYFHITIEQFDKTNYEEHIYKETYYYNACEDKIVKYDDRYADYEKYDLALMNYYISPDEIYFERTVIKNNIYIIISARFDKNIERKNDYSSDINAMISIMNSLKFI